MSQARSCKGLQQFLILIYLMLVDMERLIYFSILLKTVQKYVLMSLLLKCHIMATLNSMQCSGQRCATVNKKTAYLRQWVSPQSIKKKKRKKLLNS